MDFVHLHLMGSHIPIIGILLLIPVLLIALMRKSDEISKLALWGIAAVAVSAVAVYFTGAPTEDGVERLAGISKSMIERHEDAAMVSTIVLAVLGLLALGALIRMRRKPMPRGIVVAALVGSAAATGAFAWTANLGGQIGHSEIANPSAAVVAEDDD